MKIKIEDIKVNPGRRETDLDNVDDLAQSIAELGLLNPITISSDNTLIAGFHRLEAAKSLGWTEIECNVTALEGLRAELAEIDENVIRSDLSGMELGELLLRRKKVYEALHPETKHGKRNGQTSKDCNLQSLETKSFVQDTAEKMGVSPSTVSRQVQAAKNTTSEAKAIIKDGGAKLSKQESLKLSRLEPEEQKEAAELFASGEIESVDDFIIGKAKANTAEVQQKKAQQAQKATVFTPTDRDAPPLQVHSRGATFSEIVADLKNPNKDFTVTPDDYVLGVYSVASKFYEVLDWQVDPYNLTGIPGLSNEQLTYIRQQMDDIKAAADRFYDFVAERVANNDNT